MSQHNPGKWTTVRDNGINLGMERPLRIVFAHGDIDIAYVHPGSDDDNGNANAAIAATRPDPLRAVAMVAIPPYPNLET